MNDRADGYEYPRRVRFEIQQDNLESYRRAADYLNVSHAEVLCLQHEFGIYGGAAGSHILALLKELRMPVVTTLHTVLLAPDPTQRRVMEELVRRSDRLVVMARKGAEILRDVYDAPDAKVDVIPHGIRDISAGNSESCKARFGMEGRTVLMTFGLLGPGKGIEYAIGALPEIVSRYPEVVYLVVGATHPHLIAREGERYRSELERLAENLGVKDHVVFHNRFMSSDDLMDFIRTTDIYLTPYLNEAQITSGTLAYVFGSGNAVVSTPYWHARELLADGRGILVPFRDSQAITEGVCTFLEDPMRLARTRGDAYQIGREMIWPAVAGRYLESFRQACADRGTSGRRPGARRAFDLPPQRLDHIVRMTDGTGIFQHATFNVPNFHEGYCTDDNARAFILANSPEVGGQLDHQASGYLAFLAAAMNHEKGRFRNFMSHGREWLEDAGSEDSHGRALWALGTGVGRSRNDGHRRLCRQLFDLGLPAVDSFQSPRAWAFSLLGIHEILGNSSGDLKLNAACVALTGRLFRLWQGFATDDWPWFEVKATYDNARLCQALILSGRWMRHSDTLEIGLKSLRWLVTSQKTRAGHFRPIGSNGFHEKNGARAEFDQQPVECQAMVSACLNAYQVTRDSYWWNEARRAFEWFLGRNDLGLSLHDPDTGGCGDGLHPDRVNANQGAESSLAFQLALAEMKLVEKTIIQPFHIAV